MLGLMGVSGFAAIVGGAIYVYLTVGTLLWGRKLEGGAPAAKFTPIPAGAPTVVVQSSQGSAGFAAPGTFMLAMVFLVAFVLYYFINWKYLSTVWGLS
jgi:cytochrome c oxidase subunit I